MIKQKKEVWLLMIVIALFFGFFLINTGKENNRRIDEEKTTDKGLATNRDKKHIQEAESKIKEHMNKKNYEEVSKLISFLKNAESNNLTVYKATGWLYEEMQMYDRQISLYKDVIDNISDSDSDFFLGIAVAYMNMNKYEEAREYFKEAIKINPDDYSINMEYGYCLSNLNLFKEAHERLMKADSIEPEHPVTYQNMGQNYHRQNNLVMAEKMFKKAVSLSHDDASILYSMAIFYQNTGNEKLSVEYFKKAALIDGNFSENENKVSSYLNNKQKKTAEKDIKDHKDRQKKLKEAAAKHLKEKY